MANEKKGSPVEVGNTVLAMSPTTHYWMGKIVHVDAFSIVLDNSCWSDRYMEETGDDSLAELGKGNPEQNDALFLNVLL